MHIYVTRLHLYFFCCSLDYITRLLIYRYSIVSGGCLIHFRLCCLHRVIIHPETETSPLIYSANQWTGFYMIETSVMKKLGHTAKLLIETTAHRNWDYLG